MQIRLADQNILRPTSIPAGAVARAENLRLGALSPNGFPWGLVIGGAIAVAFIGGVIYLSKK